MTDENHVTSGFAQTGREQHVCLNCVEPNEPTAHFCSHCGAPMSSYAATAPFERLFAEGHVYRQAVENPRSLFVVFGIWLIFGGILAIGFLGLMQSVSRGLTSLIASLFAVVLSLVIMLKTARNYFVRRTVGAEAEAEPGRQ